MSEKRKKDIKNGLYLCKVKLQYTDYMVLSFADGTWWQYITPGMLGHIEGWIGVPFEFEPIKLLEEEKNED